MCNRSGIVRRQFDAITQRGLRRWRGNASDCWQEKTLRRCQPGSLPGRASRRSGCRRAGNSAGGVLTPWEGSGGRGKGCWLRGKGSGGRGKGYWPRGRGSGYRGNGCWPRGKAPGTVGRGIGSVGRARGTVGRGKFEGKVLLTNKLWTLLLDSIHRYIAGNLGMYRARPVEYSFQRAVVAEAPHFLRDLIR